LSPPLPTPAEKPPPPAGRPPSPVDAALSLVQPWLQDDPGERPAAPALTAKASRGWWPAAGGGAGLALAPPILPSPAPGAASPTTGDARAPSGSPAGSDDPSAAGGDGDLGAAEERKSSSRPDDSSTDSSDSEVVTDSESISNKFPPHPPPPPPCAHPPQWSTTSWRRCRTSRPS
jgi:hypothetical protein